MFTKESLYINAIKYDSQLKLEYKKLNNEEIVGMDSSTFKVEKDVLSPDITQKIIASKEEIPTTFISTLLINDTTKLVPKSLSDKLKDCEIAKFNNEYDIVVLKNTLFETKNYFAKTGIDYIYSAFHIMNAHIEKNVSRNELLMFLFNEKAFILILNQAGIIEHNEIVDLPTYDTVKKTHFYEDDLEGQKLFDELFYLELSEIIQKTINDFYAKKSGIFVEKVNILYVLKQLTNDNVEQLSKDLMLKVSYHPINIDEEVFELSRDKHIQKSFIKPNKKKKKRDFKPLYIALITILIILAVYKYFSFMTSEEPYEEVKVEKKVVDGNVSLPDHVRRNDEIEQRIKAVFSIIPNDVILKEMKMDSNNLELKAILEKEHSFSKEFKQSFDAIYKSTQSKVLDPQKKENIDSIITSKVPLALNNVEYKKFSKEYLTDELIPLERVTEQLKILMPENTIIKYLTTTEKDGVLTFKYAINILVKKPKEYFNLVNTLNNELYSINMVYPVSMTKTAIGLEVEFGLEFNQIK